MGQNGFDRMFRDRKLGENLFDLATWDVVAIPSHRRGIGEEMGRIGAICVHDRVEGVDECLGLHLSKQGLIWSRHFEGSFAIFAMYQVDSKKKMIYDGAARVNVFALDLPICQTPYPKFAPVKFATDFLKKQVELRCKRLSKRE